MTLYTALRLAGCELDNHESDLYVRDTATARTVIAQHPETCRSTRFVSPIDGQVWIDVPFAFQPWWDQHARGKP